MTRIFAHGIGCVSPAGWSLAHLRSALDAGTALPAKAATRPGSSRPLATRPVPAPEEKLAFLAHPRLRRSSPLTVYAAAAAMEALSDTKREAGRRLGIVFCVTGGCVQFSRRFYDESWRNPAMASPLVFPETVFNAPSSHLSALLDSPAVNYTCVGDPASVLQGLAIAADWIQDGKADDCLLIGAEENDWLTADAYRHFSRDAICSEGAGAILLSAAPAAVELERITGAKLYLSNQERLRAVRDARAELAPDTHHAVLCDSRTGAGQRDAAENEAWADWRGARLSPKTILGEGLAAGAAWQCVAAIDLLRRGQFNRAFVSVAGSHEHAIAAAFRRHDGVPGA